MSNNSSRRRRTTLPRQGTDLDRQIKAEMRAERRAAVDARPWGALRRLLGWPLAIVGALLFVASYMGSMAGFAVLPFDDHHLIGQFGGGAVGVIGVIWATTRGVPTDPHRRRGGGGGSGNGASAGSAHQGRTTRPS